MCGWSAVTCYPLGLFLPCTFFHPTPCRSTGWPTAECLPSDLICVGATQVTALAINSRGTHAATGSVDHSVKVRLPPGLDKRPVQRPPSQRNCAAVSNLASAGHAVCICRFGSAYKLLSGFVPNSCDCERCTLVTVRFEDAMFAVPVRISIHQSLELRLHNSARHCGRECARGGPVRSFRRLKQSLAQ